MKKIARIKKTAFFIAALAVVSFFLLIPRIAAAAVPTGTLTHTGNQAVEQQDSYFRAKVTEILAEGTEDVDGVQQEHQKVKLQILDGTQQGKIIIIDHGGTFAIQAYQKVWLGEIVIVAQPPPATTLNNQEVYYIVDAYRTPNLIVAATIFLALAIFFGRKRGLTSIIGLALSVVIIFYFIIPRIAAGGSPFGVSLIGSLAIIILTLYLSHGLNRRTTIALVSTLVTLGLAILIDYAFVHLANLSGNGTEEAFYLQFNNAALDVRGILLGGIIIGVLGVLDDVTTGQAAAIEEVHTANPSLNFASLFRSGLSVGREHIASLINTLLLAYVGASFPLLLLFNTQKTLPVWVTLNSNFMAEEIIRTLVGSATLVIAVPLTTLFAALFYSQEKINLGKDYNQK